MDKYERGVQFATKLMEQQLQLVHRLYPLSEQQLQFLEIPIKVLKGEQK